MHNLPLTKNEKKTFYRLLIILFGLLIALFFGYTVNAYNNPTDFYFYNTDNNTILYSGYQWTNEDNLSLFLENNTYSVTYTTQNGLNAGCDSIDNTCQITIDFLLYIPHDGEYNQLSTPYKLLLKDGNKIVWSYIHSDWPEFYDNHYIDYDLYMGDKQASKIVSRNNPDYQNVLEYFWALYDNTDYLNDELTHIENDNTMRQSRALGASIASYKHWYNPSFVLKGNVLSSRHNFRSIDNVRIIITDSSNTIHEYDNSVMSFHCEDNYSMCYVTLLQSVPSDIYKIVITDHGYDLKFTFTHDPLMVYSLLLPVIIAP